MKKVIFLAILLLAIKNGEAQIIPSFNFRLKAVQMYPGLIHTKNVITQNRVGYLGGLWFRLAALGFVLQPEVYCSNKSIVLSNTSSAQVNNVSLTSIDVPILAGYKLGALSVRGRLNTGPVVSVPIGRGRKPGNASFISAKIVCQAVWYRAGC